MENVIGELELGVNNRGRAGGSLGNEGVQLVAGARATTDVGYEGEEGKKNKGEQDSGDGGEAKHSCIW